MALGAERSTEGVQELSGVAAPRFLKPGYDFGAEFEFGLSLILDGIEAVDAQ
ncbi:hypothetical protein ABIB49_003713 [Arthrobacter sp. UYCu512]|uniref:hypothetical protein n=1 Tax=Arthrobacter sp. UYCu512 TaxID=3156338 RepID=UPI003391B71D